MNLEHFQQRRAEAVAMDSARRADIREQFAQLASWADRCAEVIFPYDHNPIFSPELLDADRKERCNG